MTEDWALKNDKKPDDRGDICLTPEFGIKGRKMMKDERGLYYYPFPMNQNVRMYVREGVDEVWFRMWNADDPELWDEHGWVPYDAIKKAQGIYEAKDFDPKQAYDIQIAQALIKEDKKSG